MANMAKHKQRSKRSYREETLSRERYFGHCMAFQTGVKKTKEAWKKV